MERIKRLNLDLFIRFFKISIQTFGGGYAMMPMVIKELVDKDGLLTQTNVIDDYAMGQTIPGVIGVNSSALMGYRVGGKRGLLLAVLGFITPSIIIISILSLFLINVQDNIYVKKAFIGLRAGVVALMLNSLINIAKKSLKNFICYLLFFCGIAGILIFKFHPFFLIMFGAIVGSLNGAIKKGDSI